MSAFDAIARALDLADRVLEPAEPLLQRLDVIGAGRRARHRGDEAAVESTRVRRAFAAVLVLLALVAVIDLAAAIVAFSLPDVSWLPRMRSVIVLLITLSLFYFVWRSSVGYWWAYSRLRLFGVVFPIVTAVLALIPGLYPTWMTIEQLVVCVMLVGVAVILFSAPLRQAYPKPTKVAVNPNAENEQYLL